MVNSSENPFTLNSYKPLTLISHKLCPYVQRAVIALQERGLDYSRIDIDLSEKPDWFLALSPLGRVPVLVIDNTTVLFESAVIAEYINDISGAELLSRTAVEKARQRAWIEFASATLSDIAKLYSVRDEPAFKEAVNHLGDKWGRLEQNGTLSDFFNGQGFTLVDAAFAPLFRYFDLFEKITEFDFLTDFTKVAHWRKSLAKRPSVIAAVGDDYSGLLSQFLMKRPSYLGGLARQYFLETA
ncbi:MAG: glutathione S-transferase [Alphaproteobacteria bacterium]|nr:MAG: glutathione S-transferase [Alphaproteobacteria bacterium]